MHRGGASVHMGRTSVTLDDETEAILDSRVAPEGPYESRSEAVRECIRDYERLHRRIDDLETENERLHRERRQLLETRDENTELVRYAETERAYREGSLLQRAKWWLRGMD
jgi:Arc/MetJ-type ribon-helix-helix transcriptional regulator